MPSIYIYIVDEHMDITNQYKSPNVSDISIELQIQPKILHEIQRNMDANVKKRSSQTTLCCEMSPCSLDVCYRIFHF